MNSKTKTFTALILGLALAAPLAIQAGPPDCPRGGPDGQFHRGPGTFSADRLPPYLDGVNLSEAQRTAIKDILKAKGEALRGKMQEGRTGPDELRQLSLSTEYSPEKAKALVEARSARMAEIALLHADLDNAIFLKLTAEQQQQVKQKAAACPRRHGKR